ncbi:MAG: acetyl-CoA decarbonylase/synthase complex subunit gamma [Elusimicrobia bacterium]|nr:acetyl-CoA decarbonylase/synthase complex subunit gamma [Elusimicrobiota bacterium]MBU2614529.1 acetyl-CoA decarbonylase/synthase complex subunit gamma [Elusimicrobiota bacterium]
MALTGLDIYKLLPKTNCKKCGFPTCLAFAMGLVGKKTSLDKCPDITEQAKEALASASEPPIRTIVIGAGENKIEIGGETVLFRHEKTFFHPCGLGILISDQISAGELSDKINKFNNLKFERVGQKVKSEFIAIKNDSEDKIKFANVVNEVKTKSEALLILLSDNISNLKEALKKAGDVRPVIGPATASNQEAITALAKTHNAVLLVSGKGLEEINTITHKIAASGYKEIVIDLSNSKETQALDNLTQVRRLALKKSLRSLGYPTLLFSSGKNNYEHISYASMAIAKYGSIVILPEPDATVFLPLVTLRQNIYTDPQKPVTVEPKLYAIGGTPNDKSPLIVTTNFSLTYFTVEPEILNAKMPTWLLIVDTDGLSVLTAWAAEKFHAEKVLDAMKKTNVENTVSHRKIIIPGYVSVMSGKLAEVSGWEVLIGPREASGIPKYLRSTWQG